MENQLSQARAPIFEALRAFSKERVVPFDVPGHKHGKGNPELTEFLGQATMDADVNSMKPLDNLCHPVSVIRDAEVLAAQAFGAAHAFFMVSGTTGSVQAMILSVCKRGDKIIMPRNVHRSAINALVLCGAVPVYVNPGVDPQLGIALGMSLADVERAIEANPDAKAVLVNNPTYYGVCSDLRSIVKLAHAHGMRVLADEAHGTHFSFSDALPVSAMAAGADMAAVSMHKSGGSLTQSSMLLIGPAMSEGYVRADDQPDTDDKRVVPAAGKPGHFAPESGPARAGRPWRASLRWRNMPARRSTPSAITMRSPKSASTERAFSTSTSRSCPSTRSGIGLAGHRGL